MRRTGWLLAAALALSPALACAADGSRFDGKWQTTLSCAPARDALGYAFRFVGEVKNGVYHGQRGSQGEASSLSIDGPIGADGTGRLYASGLTGCKEYVPGRDTPRGTDYGYHIDVRFGDRAGTGTRVEGRPCTLEFVRL